MYKVAVLPGDGIGPEVMKQAIKVLEKVSDKYGKEFQFTSADVGGIAIDNHGTPLPEETLKLCEESEAILFGSVGGPKWENLPPEKQPERGALLPLRKHFRLFCNIRPVKIFKALIDSSSLKNTLIPDGLDIAFFRELTGGIYFGQPKEISEDRQRGMDTMVYTVPEIERIARLAFEAARIRDNKVTSVDKANVLMTSVLWRETVTKLHEKEYSDVELNHMYVDNAAMQLVRYPQQFDVVVTGNMFGDILSDEAAMLTGSLGMLPSASINSDGFGLYEPIGGTAPDIAGQNIANPIAQILSAALMIRYSFDMDDAATSIEKAIEDILEKGYRTGDLFREGEGQTKVNTDEMGDLIVERI
ncbi:3-isopropylmalate dehydrogenase [Limisalsivibrio acetivorans]|uniref:3-isopropylmalate dehydrogenase n=1 Tax=Limisalsivibrio acetivorans TaxID=1304888 RepID=UPI0003B566E9|nr:3-isopropylmalate dehydrogenase [Limisalsivibrio acetivorans]